MGAWLIASGNLLVAAILAFGNDGPSPIWPFLYFAMIIFSEAGLRQVLAHYVGYYMRARTHLALAKDSPVPRRVHARSRGHIVATPEVGGLHRYERVAA